MHTYMHIISLSLYIYIYIYTYIPTQIGDRAGPPGHEPEDDRRCGEAHEANNIDTDLLLLLYNRMCILIVYLHNTNTNTNTLL